MSTIDIAQDHKIFKSTIATKDGRSLQVFTYVNHKRVTCNVCNIHVTGVKNAQAHENGKKHIAQVNLVKTAKDSSVKKLLVAAPIAKKDPVEKTILPVPVAKNTVSVNKTITPVSSAPVTPVANKPATPLTSTGSVSINTTTATKTNPQPTVTPSNINNLPVPVTKLLSIQRELCKDEPKPIATTPLTLPAKPESPKVTAAVPETIKKHSPIKSIAVVSASEKTKTPSLKMSEVKELFLNLEKNTDESFIGLEYLVELQQYDTEPRYHCVLCDKYGDPRTIIIHMTSTAHRMKYFDKHYPTMMKELGELRYDKEARVAVIKVLEEVSSAVEKYHGRMQPVVVDENRYKENRLQFLQQIIAGKHYSEFMGPSFVQLADKKKIANITRTVKLRADVQRKVAEVEMEQRNRDVPVPTSSKERSPRGRSSYRSRSRSASPRRDRYSSDRRRRRSSTPPEQNKRSREETEKLDKYSAMKTAAVKEVEVRYAEYELHPEKHPLYPAEWEAFWNRRYKELQAENKDANSYDYKPEWIAFWIRRLKELFNADVEAAKRDIKIKLGFPPTTSPTRSTSDDSGPRRAKRRSSADGGNWSDREDRDPSKRFRRDRSPSESSRGRPSSNRRSSRSPSRSTVQSKRRLSRSPSLDRRERIRELDRIISRLPGNPASSSTGYERDRERDRGYDQEYRYSSRDRDRGSDRDRYGDRGKGSNYDRDDSPVVIIDDDDDREPVTVVNVLRILSALEDQLGSMGTKTLDMLAKALAMEKAKANSSDDQMMCESNAVFFETIKEKLKGQLITGVLNKSKVNAVKKAVRKLAEILHEIAKKSKAAAEKAAKEESQKRTIVIKVTMDKAMIAQRIALALVTEKKTDVSPEQLEVLINVFFEMLRKSKELNRMVTTQDYIEVLEEQRVQSVAEKVDILGIIGKRDGAGEESPGTARKSDKPVVKLNFDLDDAGDKEGGQEVDLKEEEEEDMFGKGDGFSDSDLQTLLSNFRDLSSDEQQHLIRHLKRLETESPERVEKLRKFVNFDGVMDGGGMRRSGGRTALTMSEELNKRRNRWSDGKASSSSSTPVTNSLKLGPVPPPNAGGSATIPAMVPAVVVDIAGLEAGEKEKVKFDMKKKDANPPPLSTAAVLGDDEDDDDDDYSLHDVVKAAARNLEAGKAKGTSEKRGLNDKDGSNNKSKGGSGFTDKAGNGKKEEGSTGTSQGGKVAAKERSVSPDSKRISETHSLIANIMGSLQKKAASASSSAAGGSSSSSTPKAGVSASSNTNAKPVAGPAASNKTGAKPPAAAASAGSLPFYQQQNSSYKSTYQEQIAQQQQQQEQYMQYQQQMQQGGYDMSQHSQHQQQMMYQQHQQQQGNGGGQWWPNQGPNQMYNNQGHPQQQWNNNYGGNGPQQQYPGNNGNGQGGYGNYY